MTTSINHACRMGESLVVIVRAVAGHNQHYVAGLNLFHFGSLVPGQHFDEAFVQSELVRHPLGCRLVVAGENDAADMRVSIACFASGRTMSVRAIAPFRSTRMNTTVLPWDCSGLTRSSA